MNARTLIEAETPKQTFKSIPRHGPTMAVGEEVLSATGDTREIIAATLAALKALDRKVFFNELNDEVAAYLRGEDPADFDPEYYCYEQLFDVMFSYCPPYSYYGTYEADGSIGCWPYDDTALEEAQDRGKLTIVRENTDPGLAARIERGDFTGIETPHVMVEYPRGTKALWDTRSRAQVWQW